MNTLRLKKGKEKPLARKHPWIFSGAFQKIDSDLKNGSWVTVENAQGEFVCCGHFSIGSIAVRVLSYSRKEDIQNFYEEKVLDAYNYRKQLNLPNENTNIYRLVFGEGDGLAGLIIDYYNQHVVVQCHSAGMQADLKFIKEALLALPEEIETIYAKSEKEGEFLFGEQDSVIGIENGAQFLINWVEGQKTGFFIDQRENRNLLKSLSHNKNVLNVFSYTGGFSVYALLGGARKVVSVDLSQSAIELANKNAQLNNAEERHEGHAIDAFDHIKKEAMNYDIVVLDPPAFAKRRNASHNAVQGYKRLNALTMKKMKKGALLFTFSCSQNISRQLFNDTIRAAAIEAGRNIRILHQLYQPIDHPINIFHPEGEYLKGLVLQVS
ncbi:MAG: class I SAM-dependent rRNA methyltransferase [Schleiferiaceae bacterium]|nr:class I SAM-dependent rRNA methyltransferase [Schleiferiaceae bacterium]